MTTNAIANTVDWTDELLEKKAQAKIVYENYKRGLDPVDARREGWSEWYDGYRSFFQLPEDAGVSEISVPSIFADVEAYLPRLATNRAEIGVWPRAEDDRGRAAKHRALVGQFWDGERMNMELVDFVKSAKIFGTSIWKVVYEKRSRMRTMRVATQQPITLAGGALTLEGQFDEKMEFKSALETTQNGPRAYLMDLDEIIPDPDGYSIESCAWIIHEKRTSIEDVIASLDADEGIYDDAAVRILLKWMKDGNQEDQNTESLKYDRETTYGQFVSGIDPHKRIFHELECWYDGKVVSIVKENPELPAIQHRMNPLGRKPFVKFTPIPLPKEFYGISLVEVLFPLAIELNLLHAARLDNLLYASHQMFKVLRTANLSPSELAFRPGGVIYVDDQQDVQELQTSPKSFALYRESDEIRTWQQRAGGATDTFQGLSSNLTGGTATEASLLSQASGSRVGLMLKLLTEGPLADLGGLVIILNEIFMDETQQVRIMGDTFGDFKFTTVKPEDLINRTGLTLDMKIDVAAADPDTRQLRLQRGTAAMQTFGSVGMPLNHPIVERMMLEVAEGFGIDDAPALIEEGRQAIAQQQAEQAAQAQGGQAASGPSAPAASEAELLAAQGGAEQGGSVI